MMNDRQAMQYAVRAARRGVGRTCPNPPVGAVVVADDGTVIARGYHRKVGGAHGEAEALQRAGARARGATLYVTLEPCNHHGRTPPCTEAVLASGVRRVVVGIEDPNPDVAGGGIARLRAAGLEVTSGVCRDACEELLRPFRRHSTTGLPWVTLKMAASLDGRIATSSGSSQWITSAAARRAGHRLRNTHDAILVGAETVIQDNPQLTCRIRGGRDPLRVVLDGRLRLPLDAALVTSARQVPTVVVTTTDAPQEARQHLEAQGVEVCCLPGHDGRVALPQVMRELGNRGLLAVLIEGGAAVAAAALHAEVVDELYLFYAPKIIGGDGRPMWERLGIQHMSDALCTGPLLVKQYAPDILVRTLIRRKGINHADTDD